VYKTTPFVRLGWTPFDFERLKEFKLKEELENQLFFFLRGGEPLLVLDIR
jgi:hypothetical protein